MQGIVLTYECNGPLSKAGGDPYYIHKIRLAEGEYTAFGKTSKHVCAPGDRIEFDFTEKGEYKNIVQKSFKILERGAVKVPELPKRASAEDTKQAMICRQSALAQATNLVMGLSPKKEAGITQLQNAAKDAAELIVKIADTYFFPYSSEGIVAGSTKTSPAPSSPTASVVDDEQY